jgi:hypothetical protein
LFPNVILASEEQPELEDHYKNALADAASRGVGASVADFETMSKKSHAVINRSLSELEQLAGNDFEVYKTYYHLSEGIRLQKGEEFDSLRQAADGIFFTGYRKEIRFAALSLDSTGLYNYGDCSWILRENMITHRASVFVENTTLYYMKNDIKGSKDIPKGYRAAWGDRAKLCVVKLASEIDVSTSFASYPGIILHQGATSADDAIVEVHIFGPMTIRTIEEVTFKPIPTTISKRDRLIRSAKIEGVKEKLSAYGVKVS